jgi:16S rRNA (adenine1518-N6/adenine1519-N6)-dimethyltransferase
LINFRPKKSLGQNFLKNPRVVEKIIRAADLSGNELVVEVGPGFGILTEALLKAAERVIAIEKDLRLFLSLQAQFKNVIPAKAEIYANLTLIHADALKIPPPKEPYFLIANIPYSITSPLLDHFIRDHPDHLPLRAVLLVQKEVAQKICAAPPRMNVLALHVQTFGNPKIIATVSRHNFKPVPKVDSAIIKINFHLPPTSYNLQPFFSLIHRGFSQKRKMLRSLLPPALLAKAGIAGTRRAETLSLEEWKKLTNLLDT